VSHAILLNALIVVKARIMQQKEYALAPGKGRLPEAARGKILLIFLGQ
jgi:hypothetical protein